MKLPPPGHCLPCEWVRNRDADTWIMRLRTGQEVAIRPIGFWAVKKTLEAGRAALAFVNSLFEEEDEGFHVYFPLTEDKDGNGIIDVTDILKRFSFDRIPGHVFLGTENVSDIMMRHDHGYRTKALLEKAHGEGAN